MFDEIIRAPYTETTYYAVFQSWEFILEGKIKKKKIKIAITLHSDGLYTINLYNEKQQRQEYYRVTEHASIVKEMDKFLIFKKIIKEIKTFEEKMGEKIETTDEKVEKNSTSDEIFISFRLISPILETKRFSLEKKEEIEWGYFKENDVFSLRFKRKNRKIIMDKPVFLSISSKKLEPSMWTHSSFIEDIVEKILNKPSVRIKLLFL